MRSAPQFYFRAWSMSVVIGLGKLTKLHCWLINLVRGMAYIIRIIDLKKSN